MLKRKIDKFLIDWKQEKDHNPLIIKGARQIGKTTSIENFGKSYDSFISINFLTNPEYKDIFAYGYSPKDIILQISLINPSFKFIPHKTLILFDEIQAYPDATTSLKFFKIDGRYDVICSGSLSGINYQNIRSISVGYKQDYQMYSLDFEEFLWAKGYKEEQINNLFNNMVNLKPLTQLEMDVFNRLFEEYIYVGGMPKIVDTFIKDNHYSRVFQMQQQLYIDYEDDISKYVEGLDKAKVKNVYTHISSQLAKTNHKFQITKLGHGARLKDYFGCNEWLLDAGIINIAYKLNDLSFPFKGNEVSSDYRVYYSDTSLLVATLDSEAKKDLTINKNFGIYSGAIYENLIAEALVKQGYDIYYYLNKDSTLELDFLVRSKNEIIPIEVKARTGRTVSLDTVLKKNNLNINYGIKFAKSNIGFTNNKFTFPYFLAFLLNRFLNENKMIRW